MLRRRRELVLLSADVQRATVVHRINCIDASPARLLFDFAVNATRIFAVRRIALTVLRLILNR